MKVFEKLQYQLPNLIIIFFLSLITLIFLSITSYVDIFNFCFIGIDGDVTRGREDTIKKAIKLIKKQDVASYRTLCSYVDTIKERYCLLPTVPLKYTQEPGCYIKGSKVIYLIPDKRNSPKIIEDRAKTITKYTEKSKNFWSLRN